MREGWDPDPNAPILGRIGRSPQELGVSSQDASCPEILELANGDYAVIGRDLTDHYAAHLPAGVSLGPGERLLVIPGPTLRAAKPDIPDA